MAWYVFTCDECQETQDVVCPWVQLDSKWPSCLTCGARMRRDFHAEHFAGVAHRSKGIYGAGIIENFGDTEKPTVITSYDQHVKELKKRNLSFHDRSTESKQRRKYARDRSEHYRGR